MNPADLIIENAAQVLTLNAGVKAGKAEDHGCDKKGRNSITENNQKIGADG